MLVTFCVAGVAKADQRNFEGRWVANNHSLTLDLSRCDGGWCGIEVTSPGSCGRTMLPVGNDDGELTGRLELSTDALPYAVTLHLFRRNPNDPETLTISGHSRGDTVTEFRPWRRVYPYMVEFTRVGDATCGHNPKVF